MSEGYGYDWTIWDKLVRDKFASQLEKLPACKYKNFEVFRSPKGRWMAFYNDSYSDVKVIDLETLETVATNVYSNRVSDAEGNYDKEKSFYASHTNTSTFVPTYMRIKDDKYEYFIDPTDLEEGDIEEWARDFNKIISLPFAFNSWTIWAADYELYVDVLDLREVDNGIIKVWEKKTSFIIPHGASHVRNYVKFDVDFNVAKESSFGNIWVDFTVLQERSRDRLMMRDDNSKLEFYDMYRDKPTEENRNVYNVESELPWEAGQRRMQEWRAEQEKKNV